MSLNCNEINRIISELNVQGAFIQEIIQSGYDTLGLKIINKGDLYNLIICTSPKGTRLNLTTQKFPKNDKPLRFNEFLKSRVQGMRINDIHQIGLDRIIKMDVSTWKEKLFIYIRLWSNAANIIVTDTEGQILDCMFRRPNRGEITGGHFAPEEITLTQEQKDEALEKFPVRNFADVEFPEGCTGFNQKIDYFYREHGSALSREALLEQAEKWYNVKHSKMEAALEKLLEKKKNFESADMLRHTGDLILAFPESAKDSTLSCTDWNTGKEVHIRINPKLSAQENAAVYYEQYKKASSGMDALLHDIELSKKTLAQLEAEYNAMLHEQNVIKLEQLLRKDTMPRQKAEKNHAGLHYEINGWTILVGRTANENDDLLRHTVKGQDMWLHTRDYAGGYVFIKAQKGKTVPLEILLYAGNLAVWHSKARKNGQADLYYTQVKYLRRAKNGPKGLVLPTNEKNLLVKIDEEKMRRLDEYEKSTEAL